MFRVVSRPEDDAEAWTDDREPAPSTDMSAAFVSALSSGSDSRIVTDPRTGLNKYLCPDTPAPNVLCFSSCTASPISTRGFERAFEAFTDIAAAPSPRQRTDRIAALSNQIETRLLRYFGATALARAFLCPSGTDALLTTAMLIAAERPNEVLTAILPSASETGTGVPAAAELRLFDGPKRGTPVTGRAGNTIEILIRSANGTPRSDDDINQAFADAAAATGDKAVVYLTHSTKTGLVAPVSPPEGWEVIVDACQGRIAPETVAAYLRRGWPVVVTGSKFFGGPAFSGAVLFPLSRHLPSGPWLLPPPDAQLGTSLRWMASLSAVDAFESKAGSIAETLAARIAVLERGFAANPALLPVAGLRSSSVPGWAGLPSIFTFGVRDPVDHRRMLSAAELRPLYERLAQSGVLLGQPVGLAAFGGLRIAFGARDLLDVLDDRLTRLFAALEQATSPSLSGSHA